MKISTRQLKQLIREAVASANRFPDGAKVRLAANPEEGWEEELGTVDGYDEDSDTYIVTIDNPEPGDDGMREVTPDQLKLISSKSTSKLSNAVIPFRETMSQAQKKMYDRLYNNHNTSLEAYTTAIRARDQYGKSISDQKLGTLCTIALEDCDKWISFCKTNNLAPPILPPAISIRNKLSRFLKQDNFKKI